jgi:hypothetical protein
MSAYIKKSEKTETNSLIVQLKVLEKQEQAEPKISSYKKIINDQQRN